MKAKITINLLVPTLPLEVYDTSGNKYSFVFLTDSQIENLGKQWAKALIARNKE